MYVIKVQSSEIVPADVILLQVSEPNPDSHQGICYIETKSLDGETNLKTRSVTPEFFKKVINTLLISLYGYSVYL